MDPISPVVTLSRVGALLWLADNSIPMDRQISRMYNGDAAIAVIIW